MIPSPWSDTTHKINEYITKKWTSRKKDEKRLNYTKQFHGKPDKMKAKGVMMLSSGKLKLWVECITGHNNLAYFQNKLNSELDPTCRLCNE